LKTKNYSGTGIKISQTRNFLEINNSTSDSKPKVVNKQTSNIAFPEVPISQLQLRVVFYQNEIDEQNRLECIFVVVVAEQT